MSVENASEVIVAGDTRIPVSCLRFEFSRSSGPGGQNVNKVNTRVTLYFDLIGTDALTDVQKRRIRTRLRTRISKEGELRVVSSRHRTQAANRRAAVERLAELLTVALERKRHRIPTRATKLSKKRRLDNKSRRSETKQLRRRPRDE